MPCLHFVCVFCLSPNLISPNGKPQATTQSTQCVGGQVNATCTGHGLSVIHTHTHTHRHTLLVSVRILHQKTRLVSLTAQYSSQETKTIYKTAQRCEMLTRRGLAAVLRLGQCHFNRWATL